MVEPSNITILGFWLNLACLFFLSRISVGSFSPQPSHAYIVVIRLIYYFVYAHNFCTTSIDKIVQQM